MVETFIDQIEAVRRMDVSPVKQIDIDLSIALVDHEYDIAGNFFYVWEAPTGMSIDVKVNRSDQAAVTYVKQTGVQSPFSKLLITTPTGQTGTLKLLIGTELPTLVRPIDNRAAISGDIVAVRDELRGDTTPETVGVEKTVGAAAVEIISVNADRKGCMLQAKSTNTGIVYVGFDNSVTATRWVAELLASMAITFDDYRGDLWAYGSAAGQLVGWGEW